MSPLWYEKGGFQAGKQKVDDNHMVDNFEIRRQLQEKLKPHRYEHTLGVSYTAVCLAMRYGCDMKQAELAGLLHDCARQFKVEEMVKKCTKYEIEITESERQNPLLLHAKLGARIASEEYHVEDPEILSAIRYHTTGRPAMTLLDKIIYLADYIEPRRDQAPDLDTVRPLAFQDLDACIYLVMKHILEYLEQTGGVIDETTRQAYAYYKERRATDV